MTKSMIEVVFLALFQTKLFFLFFSSNVENPTENVILYSFVSNYFRWHEISIVFPKKFSEKQPGKNKVYF